MLTLSLPDQVAEFQVLESTKRSQAALMVLAPGQRIGDRARSEHPQADQWLYVLSGQGEAFGEDERHVLRPGTLLVVPAGQGHEIRNPGKEPLRTLNLYSTLAYDSHGEPLFTG
jgi:mannose-6-phosphate isomerase-like protein (cupin superfamily)